MSLLSDVIRILTLDCRESSQLVSESLDRGLRWPERIALRLHGLGCWSCRRLRRQLFYLREVARQYELRANDQPASAGSPMLSASARERIKVRLREAGSEPPGD